MKVEQKSVLKKRVICAVLVLSASSCATVKTIDPPKNHINISHYGKKAIVKVSLEFTVAFHIIYVCFMVSPVKK
ncbi:hypothetical protein L3081_22310 [Colwellia sp. MSW7]|uniref:Uncharacterized protein n=1 Tax=Colwellia maritima TaxID=2912588 RepID=A0ABS9X6A9_9GAMM|nr:hypothetical protein [Colwellia maritima]MCI2285615.1 hypothetical protein [Colwellia maritima]